jgi:hypothetical protein
LQAAFCGCHAKESPGALPINDRERRSMFRETGAWKELLREALEIGTSSGEASLSQDDVLLESPLMEK